MASVNEYLQSGPYRLAIWSLLSRLKVRAVHELVQRLRESRADEKVFSSVARALAADATEVASSLFQSKLAGYTHELFVVTEGHRSVDDSRAMAARRQTQLVAFLQGASERFQRLAEARVSSDFEPSYNELFSAVSEILWPYYFIAYKDETGKRKKATWQPTAEMMVVPFAARYEPEYGSSGVGNVPSLFPSLGLTEDPHSAAWLDESNLETVSVLRVADRAISSLSASEQLVGHIQAVDESVERTPQFVADLWSRTGAYWSDYFYCNRACVSKWIIESNSRAILPLGQLFLCFPSASAMQLLAVAAYKLDGDQSLIAFIDAAWQDSRCTILAEALSHDLRGYLKETKQGFLKMGEQHEARRVAHAAKNDLDMIAGLVAKARHELETSPKAQGNLLAAEFTIWSLQASFALSNQLFKGAEEDTIIQPLRKLKKTHGASQALLTSLLRLQVCLLSRSTALPGKISVNGEYAHEMFPVSILRKELAPLVGVNIRGTSGLNLAGEILQTAIVQVLLVIIRELVHNLRLRRKTDRYDIDLSVQPDEHGGILISQTQSSLIDLPDRLPGGLENANQALARGGRQLAQVEYVSAQRLGDRGTYVLRLSILPNE